ncbi:sel1 repeat family protein [Roseicyclus persicicus]|uniref:Sel1 repeat family protein n=1 Tax=Roseicyclus persicicus TaxID=2650661 RepID=A0A7X6GYS4_9RHOB|nr:sel1 repeat family protein [Roseibacterium persicicum]NKX43988.1 sel1 repeat family protein [Roseibacterium persicicum]
MNRVFLAILSLGLAVAGSVTPASADRLDPRWDADRSRYIGLSDLACAGNTGALQELSRDAGQFGNPVAMNAYAWLALPSSNCTGAPVHRDTALDYWYLSAEAGFPPGMYNWAMANLDGVFGLDRDVGEGLHWLENAAGAGFALAASELALIYAEGRHGVRPDAGPARHYLRTADQLGLAPDRLQDLTGRVDAALARGAPRPQPQPAPQPGPAAPAGGDGYFQVSIGTASSYGGRVPRLGDRQSMGNWVDEVVYVAQAFGREGGCWTTGSLWMVGRSRVELTQYAAATLEQMIQNSAQDRQAGRSAPYVQDFRDLNDGISFVERNQGRVDNTGLPFMWTLAEAQAYGPRCSGNTGDVVYPAPVRAQAR